MKPEVSPILLLAVHLVPSYPDGEQDRSVAGTSSNILWVEGDSRLVHERRLQDVPTLTILQEPALV